ncbi:putative YhdH/YhfP family quinone oxidoreductase [Paenibacillus taihuensis]|uniref:Putative YhdH/YhfP family quinone oxidoreductase n=1 Tax=Paenibacillus taihuensis TaxID=1156355 RepID=A0A3D9R0K8_9BACL|nr:acryloyl-CoA reductase [Paenibacillus taihuensis]REE67600.1 putative YhdH/YhfP family quinone oxidoreductase [Paenibacillus taihuensis]
MNITSFKALMVDKQSDRFEIGIRDLSLADLPQENVTIRVSYSSINYKDGLAATPDGRVLRAYPMIPGIDLAGTVVSSSDSRWREGDEVIATGYGLGTDYFGGYSEYARIRGDWLTALPQGLTLREAMIIGTAGFTAALSLHRLESNGLVPGAGPVLVLGATGGVGSHAVAMLARAGYDVTASTGKSSEHDYLRMLGAREIISREALQAPEGSRRALNSEHWAAAVDPVGGASLPYVLSTIRYGGSVALSGLTGGGEFPGTVFPFILRGVNLLGIDSVYCPSPMRETLWQRIASDWKPARLDAMVSDEVSLADLPAALPAILKGGVRGRTVVRIAQE